MLPCSYRRNRPGCPLSASTWPSATLIEPGVPVPEVGRVERGVRGARHGVRMREDARRLAGHLLAAAEDVVPRQCGVVVEHVETLQHRRVATLSSWHESASARSRSSRKSHSARFRTTSTTRRRSSPEKSERIRRPSTSSGSCATTLPGSCASAAAGRSRYIAPDVSNPFFATIAEGVEQRAAVHDLTVFISNSNRSRTREDAYLDLFEAQRVQGMLVASTTDRGAPPADPRARHSIGARRPARDLARPALGLRRRRHRRLSRGEAPGLQRS